MEKILMSILLTMTLNGISQSSDYAKLRPNIMIMVCGAPDSGTVKSSLRNLLALDTSRIKRNMNMYYEDIGQCYWLLSTNDPADPNIVKCIEANRKALYHKPKSTKALWNLACAYIFTGDCSNGLICLEKYSQYIRPKYIDHGSVQQLKLSCSL